MSKSPLESTWLYHEIGRCHLELGNYEKAKEYGEKSLASAQEADDPVWQLNATVLIAQAEGMWVAEYMGGTAAGFKVWDGVLAL